MKLGRVTLNLDYVVDMDNDQMVKQAIECFYEDGNRRYDSRIFIGERK